MSVFCFLHAADIHLDSPLLGLERYEGAPVEEIRGATRRALENLVALAIEEGVAFVVIAGDLYDGDWKDYNTGLFFVRQMARLADAGIPVFVVAGNHDAASQITRSLRPPSNVHFFATTTAETVTLEASQVALHGRGFATREVTEDISAGYPAAVPGLVNIGILHTSLTGRPGHQSYAPCSIDGLRAKGYQYWALGHVHQREVVCQEPWIVFPGNTQGRHAREPGAKGCSLVTVADGDISAVEHRDLDVVRWALCEVDVTGSRTLDQVLQHVEAALQATADGAAGRLAATRLLLSGSTPFHGALHARRAHLIAECRALAAVVGGDRLWLEKVLLETSPSASSQPGAGDDGLGGLLARLEEVQEPDRAALAEELVELRRKLPPELLNGPDGFDPSTPEALRSGLEDAKALLIERLLGRSDAG